jgi:uncharacterized membrane protein
VPGIMPSVLPYTCGVLVRGVGKPVKRPVKSVWFWLMILVVAAALVASAILFVDYVKPSPVFCEADGCGKVKATVFARPFGVPLPAFGLIGMLGVGLAALVPGRTARRVQAVLAVVGALVAVGLFVVQAKLNTICPFCAVVDGSAIVLAVLSILRLQKKWDPPRGRLAPTLAALGLVASIAIPVTVGLRMRVLPGGLPQPIAEEMRKTGSRKVTVVDFVDFECPFCRMTHAEIAPLIEARKSKVRVARKHVPLRMHPHALDAAKAGCCGEDMGKGEEIADALFKAPPVTLTPEGCEAIAKAHGLDVAKFRACMQDPATASRIEKDKEAFRAVKGHGLPTIWVDGVKLEGAQERSTLESTLDTAIGAL